jgi:hypothetical protein
MYFGIAGLIGSIVAYWIAFAGASLEWRPRWHGNALIMTGVILFCCSLGAIVLTAYQP